MESWNDYEVVDRGHRYIKLRHIDTGKTQVVDNRDLYDIFTDVPVDLFDSPTKSAGKFIGGMRRKVKGIFDW